MDSNYKSIYKDHNQPLKKFYHFLSEIDCFCSGAKVSVQNGYYRPKIIESDKSFINAKDLRHPIVEKIHVDTEYVTNDISLGDNVTKKDGILLFGTNACGKSTLMSGWIKYCISTGWFICSS